MSWTQVGWLELAALAVAATLWIMHGTTRSIGGLAPLTAYTVGVGVIGAGVAFWAVLAGWDTTSPHWVSVVVLATITLHAGAATRLAHFWDAFAEQHRRGAEDVIAQHLGGH